MAFLAVYREVFETVLFYEALLVQAGDAQTGMVIGGLLVTVVVLAVITCAMLRYSLRLPLDLFFGASGILLAVLSVILAGNGIAALQEAGVVPISPVAFVTISWLGVQVLLVGAIGFALMRARRVV